MDLFKSEMCRFVGIAGFSCPCCNDFFSKSKKKLNRKARAALKIKTRKLVNSEILYRE